jgi:hydroxyacylglutathione hydrolase
MNLLPLPAFADNYIWLVHDGRRALVVDPGDAQPVFEALQREGLQLDTILVTHHHADHTGGVNALRDATGARVLGPARETVPEPLERLNGGDRCSALGIAFEVLDVPGHTAGHIAFFAADFAGGGPVVFCGDTLFSGGCGRLFEGTPAQMLESLTALAALPPETLVCCAHEYTLGNLKFAMAVEPANAELIHHTARCEALRAANQPTLPSRIGLEREINPFLRTRVPQVREAAQAFDHHTSHDEASVLGALRTWKNQFK